jgi:hypothetical protein
VTILAALKASFPQALAALVVAGGKPSAKPPDSAPPDPKAPDVKAGSS